MQQIIKRNGEIEQFDSSKITDAISKASDVTQEFDRKTAKKLTKNVVQVLTDFAKRKQ